MWLGSVPVLSSECDLRNCSTSAFAAIRWIIELQDTQKKIAWLTSQALSVLYML